jgi:glycerol-3-phosphate acyltransferase PlsY
VSTFYIILVIFGFSLFGYGLGSLLFAELIAKSNDDDIRKIGSKNPGATNIKRKYGKKIGILVSLLDVSKGYIAVVLCSLLFKVLTSVSFFNNNDFAVIPYVAGVFAVIGHCYPMH